eukprot:768191-Hanusia_phi.AAC.5
MGKSISLGPQNCWFGQYSGWVELASISGVFTQGVVKGYLGGSVLRTNLNFETLKHFLNSDATSKL